MPTMEQPQAWGVPLSESPFNPASSMTVSSYFTRPSRVVKPSSRNSSPQTLGRRKTTTSATISSRTRSVVDHLRSNTQQYPNLEGSRSRPISWHPDSAETLQIPSNQWANVPDLSNWNFSTAEINGLVTPISFPAMNEPLIQELFTPLDELSGPDLSFGFGNPSGDEPTWQAQGQSKSDPYSMQMFYQPPPLQSSWQLSQPPTSAHAPTAPPSPECLPLQNIGLDTLSIHRGPSASKGESDELVGMGLYDSPAEVQSSSLLFGGFSASSRKSLKLEESFEPTECDLEEGAEEEEEDEASHECQSNANDDIWETSSNYASQSIANHLTLGAQPQADSLAFEYLATLRQLNSAYCPAGYNVGGWI